MSFLRFLKNKGVSENIIIEATIWQQESSKPLLAHMKDHPHITSEMLFDLIDESSKSGMSLEEVQLSRKIIPTEYYQECIDEYERSLDSIATFLVDKGHMKLEAYEAALLEYMASHGPVEVSNSSDSSETSGSSGSDNGDDSEMISDAALESLRELVGNGGLDESTIAELESSKKK